MPVGITQCLNALNAARSGPLGSKAQNQPIKKKTDSRSVTQGTLSLFWQNICEKSTCPYRGDLRRMEWLLSQSNGHCCSQTQLFLMAVYVHFDRFIDLTINSQAMLVIWLSVSLGPSFRTFASAKGPCPFRFDCALPVQLWIVRVVFSTMWN